MSSLSQPAPGGSARTTKPVLVAEQRQLFQRVLHALQRGKVSFTVAGAFAFQHYTGIWRFTKDLDLFLPANAVERALELCRDAGLVTEITDPVWLAKAWAGDYFVDLITGMSNGIYSVTQAWIEHAQEGDVLGHRLLMLAPEEMVLSKLFVTRRERFDGADICHLIHRCGNGMNWERLRRAVGEHWAMLLWHLLLFRYVYPADRDAVPAWLWNDLRERLEEDLRELPPGPFRGSLIDPPMFAPDIVTWGLENLEDSSRRRRLRELAA